MNNTVDVKFSQDLTHHVFGDTVYIDIFICLQEVDCNTVTNTDKTDQQTDTMQLAVRKPKIKRVFATDSASPV